MVSANLLLSCRQRRLRRRWRCAAALMAAGVAGLACDWALAGWVRMQVDHVQGRVSALRRIVAITDAPRRARQARDAAAAASRAAWRQREALLQRLETAAVPWSILLADIATQREAGLRLTGVRHAAQVVQIAGEASDPAAILQYKRRLDALPWVSTSSLVEVRSVGGPEGEISAAGIGKPGALRVFSLQLTLAAAPAAELRWAQRQ